MTELNTSPWFTVLLTSWTALLFILTPKILSSNFPSNLTTSTTKAYKATAGGQSWY